jgi:hypothetical protein
MFLRVKDAVAKPDDRAQLGIAGAREANNFTTHTIFLRVVNVSVAKVVERMLASVARRRSRRRLPIQSWMSQSRKGLGGNCVFTWVKEIVESDAAHVGNGKVTVRSRADRSLFAL